jgi:hypothetical protein
MASEDHNNIDAIILPRVWRSVARSAGGRIKLTAEPAGEPGKTSGTNHKPTFRT